MNMYVSNLSFHTGEDELRKLFEEFGVVTSVKVVTDRETGRSRGFGFVEMSSQDEADNAMKSLNNKDIQGRAMSVSVAREKSFRPNNGKSKW